MTVKRWLNRELRVETRLAGVVSTRKGPVKKKQVVVRPAQRLTRRVPTASINYVALDGEAVQVRAVRGVAIKCYRCEPVTHVVAIGILGCTPPANDLEGLVPHSRY